MEIQQQVPKLMTEEEEEPYSIENLPVYLSIENSTVAFEATVMQVTMDGFTFLQQKSNDQWFSCYATFANTTSVGIDSLNSLMIFVGEEDNNQYEEGKVPEILNIISASKAGGNVCLTGHCFTIRIDFMKLGKNILKEVHDIFVNYMGDADEQNNRYDEDQEMGEMISADNIDQNGNIIDRQESSSDQQCEENQILPNQPSNE